MMRTSWLVVLCAVWQFACSQNTVKTNDAGTDTDTDTDTDVDTDTDADTDTDTDTDIDTDTDTDTDETVCDDIDDDSDGDTDEGCDDDTDGYCDDQMGYSGSPAVCPDGPFDCDDEDPDIYPYSTIHQEAVDYDCDSKLEFMADINIVVDDAYPRLCWNNNDIATGITSWMDRHAENYQVVMESGDNVLGIMGEDTMSVVSAAQLFMRVAGREIRTDGITEFDPDFTEWRYFPTSGTDPHIDWCDQAYDDSAWGPAITAAEYEDNVWLLGTIEMRHFYTNWIWDGNPSGLQNSWFRRNFTLPSATPPVDPPNSPARCALVATPQILNTNPQREAYSPDLTATGTEIGISWEEYVAGAWGTAELEIFFQRSTLGGTLLGTPERITTAPWWSEYPSLAWTGTEYALAWTDSRGARNYDEIYFARVDSTGTMVTGSEVESINHSTNWQKAPSLVPISGGGFGMAWYGTYDGNREIYFTHLDSSGSHVASNEVRVTNSPGTSRHPSLAYTGSGYGVAFEDTRDLDREIYFQRINSSGALVGSAVRVTNSAGESAEPALIWNGTRFGLAWRDERDENAEIYFMLIEADGTMGSEIRVTWDGAVSSQPSLAYNGTEFVIVFRDDRSGHNDIFAARLDSNGYKLGGGDDQITTSTVASWEPDIVFLSGDNYALAWEEGGANTAVPPDDIFTAAFAILDCGP